MSDSNRSDRILALIESVQRKLDELRKILDEDECGQNVTARSDDPFNCTLGEYIERKRSTHGHKMKGLSLFSSFMNDGREISTEDSGSDSINYFRDVPMKVFMRVPLYRLLKYRLLGKKSISILKGIILEDNGQLHLPW